MKQKNKNKKTAVKKIYPYLKSKKLCINAKLSIGLTTKPFVRRGELNNTTILNILRGQKSLSFTKGFIFTGGLDGTRTRDPMRDRHVF